MKPYGIFTLANDAVYDQLVALLNSIEKNIGSHVPVCIIPYSDSLNKVNQEISSRSNVTLFDKTLVLKKWDKFVNEIWVAHSRAKAPRYTRPGWYKGFVHRKFAAFDGDFDRFVFFDADSLAMKPIEDVLAKLDQVDLVFDDWEHAKRDDVPEVVPEKLAGFLGLPVSEIYPQLHCDSFFGSKNGLISDKTLADLKYFLIEQKGIASIRDRCWWSSSALFSVLTIKAGFSLFNFTQSPNSLERTGNCADADPFVEIDGVLYNAEGLKPIHRIHYMNYPSVDFARLSKGEDVGIRYADTFLHYRFLKEIDQKPTRLVKANMLIRLNRKLERKTLKLKKLLA